MRKILFLCLCLLFLSRTATTDFGDFSGGSDYGGGSDSGWSSSGSGGWSSGGGGGYGISSGSTEDTVIILALMAVGFIVMFGIGVAGGSINQQDTDNPPGAERTDPRTLRPIGSYSSVDPNFSEEAFKRRLSNIYVELQHAWQAKDLKPVRPFLTDVLFFQYDRQLNNYRDSGTTNVMEQIEVQEVFISGWKREGEEDVIIAELRAKLIDYVIDDATGQLVRGSRTAEKHMEYEYAMSRRAGVKTSGSGRMRTVKCPNCGFAVVINQSAVCPYCDSRIRASAIDWTISGIKGLSQRTVGK